MWACVRACMLAAQYGAALEMAGRVGVAAHVGYIRVCVRACVRALKGKVLRVGCWGRKMSALGVRG